MDMELSTEAEEGSHGSHRALPPRPPTHDERRRDGERLGSATDGGRKRTRTRTDGRGMKGIRKERRKEEERNVRCDRSITPFDCQRQGLFPPFIPPSVHPVDRPTDRQRVAYPRVDTTLFCIYNEENAVQTTEYVCE